MVKVYGEGGVQQLETMSGNVEAKLHAQGLPAEQITAKMAELNLWVLLQTNLQSAIQQYGGFANIPDGTVNGILNDILALLPRSSSGSAPDSGTAAPVELTAWQQVEYMLYMLKGAAQTSLENLERSQLLLGMTSVAIVAIAGTDAPAAVTDRAEKFASAMTSLDASIEYIKNNPDAFGRDIVTAIIREGEAIDALAAQGKTKEAGERAGALLADLGMIAGGVQLGVLAGANALKAIDKGAKVAGTVKTAQVGEKGGESLGASLLVPGRVQSRINLMIGDSKAGWEHVIRRHFNPECNASQFIISQSELKALLQSKEVVHTSITNILKSEHGLRYVREVDVGKHIGFDKFTGRLTSTMSILTDSYGNLITATPGVLK